LNWAAVRRVQNTRAETKEKENMRTKRNELLSADEGGGKLEMGGLRMAKMPGGSYYLWPDCGNIDAGKDCRLNVIEFVICSGHGRLHSRKKNKYPLRYSLF